MWRPKIGVIIYRSEVIAVGGLSPGRRAIGRHGAMNLVIGFGADFGPDVVSMTATSKAFAALLGRVDRGARVSTSGQRLSGGPHAVPSETV